MPKIFHVNWFRTNKEGKFLWPGYGDNIRVIDWICRRLKGEDIADKTAIGYLPKPGNLFCRVDLIVSRLQAVGFCWGVSVEMVVMQALCFLMSLSIHYA